jgi:uncharacterized repeat protein (TIGR01451 family)
LTSAAEDKPHSQLFGVLSQALLSGGLGFRFRARGTSMVPAIRDGELLHVRPVVVEELRQGDIVLFADGHFFRAHRLVLVDRDGDVFITQGDAGGEADGALSSQQLLGKVVAKEEEDAAGRVRTVPLCGLRARLRVFAARVRCWGSRVVRRLPTCRSVEQSRRVVPRKLRFGGSSWLFLLLASLIAPVALFGQVGIDSVTSIGQQVTGATPTITLAHTSTGTNLVLVVGISINITNNTGATVTGVTYNGTALTSAGAHNDAGNTRRVEMWSLIAPAIGLPHNVVVTLSLPGGTGTLGVVVGASTFTGADQTSPLRPFVSADGAAGTPASLNVPSGVNEMVIDTLATGGDQTITFGPSQTTQWNLTSLTSLANPDVRGTGSTRTGAPSVPVSETLSGTSNWSVAALSVKPLQADVGVTIATNGVFFPQNVTYTISVTNNGPSTAHAVTLTDTLAAGLTLVSSTPTQGTCAGIGPVICTLGTMNSGSNATVTVVATPGASGSYSNTASVTATEADLNGGNNSYTAVAFVQTQVCASPAQNGNGGTLSGVINTYYPATANAAAGAKSITVGASTGAATAIAINDLLLVIQMQDAAINSTNTSLYGDGSTGSGSTNLNNSGNYEFVTATGAVPLTGGTANFSGTGAGGGLLYSYTNAAATAIQGKRQYQVIRVPQYSAATLSSTLTASAWNGSTGGILALDVAGTLTLGSATVSVDGLGFRGGAGLQLTGAAGASTDFRNTAPAAYAGAAVAGADGAKGEGIAGTPRWVESGNTFLDTGIEGYPNGSMARGAPGNAGGGGTDANPPVNDQNAGAAGGGNGGAGGSGGDGWNSNLSVGGLGGAAFPASASRIVLGGGGGAGSRNNSDGDNQASSGAAGGGIVIIRAGSLSGTATISANGAAAYNGTLNDAGGGGGAGGSVIVTSQAGGTSGLTLVAHGGRGGDAWDAQAFSLGQRHGPGGGGGGGVVLLSGSAASIDVSGGANGTTLTPGVPYGATSGASGTSATNVSLSQSPGARSGAECTPDLTIAKSHSGSFVRGSTGSYTVTVSNIALNAASSGLVTVSDPLPAGLTPTAASGSGWSCSIAAQTVTCTRSDALGAVSSYPVINITVSVAQSAAATLVNTATVSGGGELNTTNDSASDTVSIVSSSDMAITKTASPNPIKQGNTLTYTLGVTNNGPSDATNVTATDTLPSTVSYISATPTQGTCSQATGTVTCLLGAMINGASATITVKVTAVTPSSAVNSESVAADQPDPNSANNTATQTTLITFPTVVKLETFTAKATADSVLLSWKTGAELNNLGFNLYREQNGERVRLNPSLIAGSALTIRAGLPQHGAKTYAWIDRSPTRTSGLYWLEDVDLDGTRTFHGPISSQADLSAAEPPRARVIAELNGGSGQDLGAPTSHVQEQPLPVSRITSGQQQTQFQLAAHPAVKILIQREGWYRVTQPELAAAGLPGSTDPRFLRLFAQGIEQPMRIIGESEGYGNFGPQAAIEFYGQRLDSPYTDNKVYWLVVGDRPGKRIHEQSVAAEGGPQPQSFPRTVELKQRTTYFAALLSENTDNFFGALVSSTPVDQVLQAVDVASSAVDDVGLEVVLQGVTAGAPHDVTVTVNGANLGDLNFTGQDEGKISLRVPHNVIHEGVNTVTLTAQGGEDDLSLVDYITLTYPHTYTAESDSLKFTGEAGDRVVVRGFRRPPTRLLDITNPAEPLALIPLIRSESGNYTLEAKVPSFVLGTHTLLAVSEKQIVKAAGVIHNDPSSWHRAQAGAEVVMIYAPEFAGQVGPLVQLRRSQGRSVASVNVDDLYDEFNFGERSPNAIRDFLKNATVQWQSKPRYLLLFGGASVDPRNYLGFGFLDFVPTKIIVTSQLKTASDDWFSDFANTGVAQISTGRLPMRTQDDAKTVVAKILQYERNQDLGDWTNQALMVADRNDPTTSFTSEAQSVQALLPKSMKVTNVFATGLDPTTAGEEIRAAINSGKLIVNYTGHGSVEVWSGEDLLDDRAAASLTNGSLLPVFLIMNCLNGFFHDVYTESLAQALLFSKNGGAVAVWASSGLTSPEPQLQMDQNVVRSLFTQPSPSLGDATRRAKSDITDSDARRTYILFGDPLLRLKGSTVGNDQP